MSTYTYNGILSKGIEADLPTKLKEGKLRFTTDTKKIFLDVDGSRIEYSDFIKGKTEEQIKGILAPLPKLYLASDTHTLWYYDSGWKYVDTASTYVEESGHSVNADTATYATNAGTADYSTNSGTATYATSAGSAISAESATSATNASSANYATNAGTADIASSATNASSAEYAATAGSVDSVGWDDIDDKPETYPPSAHTHDQYSTTAHNHDGIYYKKTDKVANATNADTATYATNAGSATNASSANYATSAGSATNDSSGNSISGTYAPKASPVFTGTPTTPDVAAGDSSGKIANTKFVDTAITNAVSGITQFDYEVVTTLPTTGVKGKIYLVANATTATQNIYDEYIWVTNKYEEIGTTEMDLSEYVNAATVTGTGNAITGVSKSGNTITFTKDSTFLTGHPAVTHSSSTASATPAAGTSIDVITDITTDNFAHATSFVKTTMTLPNSVASATNADTATYAKNAGSSTNATSATYATNAGSATSATNSSTSAYASSVSWSNVGSKPTTFAPITGNAATQAAPGNHTHTTNIATSTGTNQLTMAANTKYALGAGDTTYIFTTPPNPTSVSNATNADTATYAKNAGTAAFASSVNVTWDNVSSKPTTFAPVIGNGATQAAAGNHTHSINMSTGGNISQINMTANTKYTLSAGGSSYTFTTPPNPTYTTSMATASNISQIDLVANTRYVLGTGGTELVFTTPPNPTSVSTATNASTADYAKNSGTAAYSADVYSWAKAASKPSYTKSEVGLGDVANLNQSKAIKNITRSGLTFTATQLDGSTFTFNQQDNDTTYGNVSSAAAGLAPKGAAVSSQSQSTKFLREDGTWAAPSYTTNTDTKVTAVGNHYTPTTNNASSVSKSASGGSDATPGTTQLVTGVTLKRDAAYHVTDLEVTSVKLPIYPTIPGTFSTAANGLVPKPASAATTSYLNSSGTWTTPTNTTYANVSSAAAGLAPKGAAVSAQSQTTKFLREDGTWAAPSYTTNTNTTYSFTGGTNRFIVTPSSGNATTVNITPSITNNVTGSGTSGYIAKWNGANTITNGPAFGSSTVTYLRNDGSWTTPNNTTYDLSGYAPKASPVFTGTPTTPDVATGDSSAKIANTKFVTSAISTAISGVTQFDYEVVTTLPTTGVKGKIYLKSNGSSTSQNIYDEYIWIGTGYEKIGTTEIDLSNYVNSVEISGSGNAITSFTKSGNTLTLNKGTTFPTTNTTYAFSNNAATLSWGGASTIGTAGSTTYTIKMPNNPNTDHLYFAGTGLNAASTSGNNTTFALSTSGATSGSYGMANATTGTNNTNINIPYITVDAYGRITSISNKVYTSKDTTYTNGTGIALSSNTFSLATTGTAGTYGPSANVTGSNGATISVPQITTDAYGRVTSVTNRTYTSVNTDNDTKNTAGSTDTSSKIFLIGATSQAANPQTYSDNEVFATNGVLTAKSLQVGGGSATIQYNSNTQSIDFVFA